MKRREIKTILAVMVLSLVVLSTGCHWSHGRHHHHYHGYRP